MNREQRSQTFGKENKGRNKRYTNCLTLLASRTNITAKIAKKPNSLLRPIHTVYEITFPSSDKPLEVKVKAFWVLL